MSAGLTPLMEAVIRGRVEEGKVLLDKGANPNELSPDSRDTALTIASKNGHSAFCKLLLERLVAYIIV